MTIEAKKEVLKYMILNDRYFHDTLSYKLLRYRYFDNAINNISEISLTYKKVIENDKIQANQFLDLLELFIKIVKERFFNLFSSNHYLAFNIIAIYSFNIKEIHLTSSACQLRYRCNIIYGYTQHSNIKCSFNILWNFSHLYTW